MHPHSTHLPPHSPPILCFCPSLHLTPERDAQTLLGDLAFNSASLRSLLHVSPGAGRLFDPASAGEPCGTNEVVVGSHLLNRRPIRCDDLHHINLKPVHASAYFSVMCWPVASKDPTALLSNSCAILHSRPGRIPNDAPLRASPIPSE